MRRLAKAVEPKPASLSNYTRMKAPCVLPKLEVNTDRQLGRVALFRQVQVRGCFCTCVCGGGGAAGGLGVRESAT